MRAHSRYSYLHTLNSTQRRRDLIVSPTIALCDGGVLSVIFNFQTKRIVNSFEIPLRIQIVMTPILDKFKIIGVITV